MEYPICLKPSRERVKANIDKAVTVKKYAEIFGYSQSHVCKLWRYGRIDGIKLRGHIFVLPEPPSLYVSKQRFALDSSASRWTAALRAELAMD